MTATEDVQRAVSLHQQGRLEDAERIYRDVLANDPDDPDALHFLGLLSFQTGNAKLAIELIKRAIERAPHYADAHSNLGNILKELGHFEDARTSYENALACEPERVEAHNNLGVLLRHMGEPQQAVEHLLTTVMLAPDWAWGHYNLGTAYSALRHPSLAAESLERALELDDSLVEAYRHLGFTLYGMKKYGDARAVYRRLLALDPTNEVAQHLLTAVSGGASPDRASEGFVRKTFADFAATFDGQLERLSYVGPALVEEVLRGHLPPPDGSLDVLDLGCGTGLCGPVVAPWARRLVGVDLSPEMLARARRRGCYDALVEADLGDYLEAPGSEQEDFDVIVSADTLIYFGELGRVLRAAAERLRPGGLLVFTLERLDEEVPRGFRLGPSGRYVHDREHVESRIRGAGLELVSLGVETLRKEFGEPVVGWVACARRP